LPNGFKIEVSFEQKDVHDIVLLDMLLKLSLAKFAETELFSKNPVLKMQKLSFSDKSKLMHDSHKQRLLNFPVRWQQKLATVFYDCWKLLDFKKGYLLLSFRNQYFKYFKAHIRWQKKVNYSCLTFEIGNCFMLPNLGYQNFLAWHKSQLCMPENMFCNIDFNTLIM